MSKRYVYKASCYFAYDWETKSLLTGSSKEKDQITYIANKTEGMWTKEPDLPKRIFEKGVEIPYCLLRNET